MARAYRPRPDGLFEVETPGVGFMPVHWTENDLRAQGFQPYQGATAFTGDSSGQGGTGNVPDAPREVPGAGGAPGIAPGAWDPSQGGAAPSLPNTGAEGAPADVETQTPATAPAPREESTGRAPVKTRPLSQARAGGTGGQGQSTGGRPRYHTTPARDVRAGYRVELGPQISAETEEQRSDAEIDLRLSEQTLADRDEERGRRDASAFGDKVLRPLERQVSADEIRVQRIRQDHEKRQAEIDQERKAVDKLEVNPRQMFEDEPWTMALAAVSLMAGGLRAGFQGGPNHGAELLQKALNMNVDAQKEKIRNRREGLRDKETELERLTKIYGSPELAEAEFRTRQASLVEAWAKHNVMRDAADDVQENLRAEWAQRDLARADERSKIDLQFGNRVTEEYRHVPGQTVQVGVGQRALKPEERKRKVNVDGQPGFVVSELQQRPVQESVDTLGHLTEQIGEYRRIAADTSLGPDQKKKALAAMKTNIGTSAAVAQGQGAMSDAERKDLDTSLGSPEDMLGANENDLARVDATANFFQSKRQRVIQSNVYADPDASESFAPRVRSRELDQ